MTIIIGLLIQHILTNIIYETLEDYENKCGDAEIDFLIDTFECNLDDRGNVWGLVINLELED